MFQTGSSRSTSPFPCSACSTGNSSSKTRSFLYLSLKRGRTQSMRLSPKMPEYSRGHRSDASTLAKRTLGRDSTTKSRSRRPNAVVNTDAEARLSVTSHWVLTRATSSSMITKRSVWIAAEGLMSRVCSIAESTASTRVDATVNTLEARANQVLEEASDACSTRKATCSAVIPKYKA